ncbi:hypothetical protein QJQ45_020939, partial [Haematococcus lacustris]
MEITTARKKDEKDARHLVAQQRWQEPAVVQRHVAGGRMYTIHSAANASLCLSFTSQHKSSSSSSGQPLQLQPCQSIELQTSTGALQVFKVVRRCSNEYMLQLWSGTEPSNSLSSPLATVYQPTPDHACMAWSPETGLAVQMPCSSERSQRWELSGQPPPTMQLCPPQPAATFFATSPYAVVATLTQLLGCPTACQQAWGAAAAAVAASGGPPPEPQAPLPSCFTVGILELFTYDGEFQQMFWSRGKRDPIRYSHASAPQLLTALAYIWGPPGRGMVRVGTPLQLWLRALDAVLLLLGALDHLALICTPSKPNGTLAPSRLPPGLLSVFTSGLRNLTLKGCGLRGGLPPDWASVGPLAVTTYVNRYPVYLDLSYNQLTGGLPTTWLAPYPYSLSSLSSPSSPSTFPPYPSPSTPSSSWLSCYVSRLDLTANQLSLTISKLQLQEACNTPASRSTVCAVFVSLNRSISQFQRHVAYSTGPTSPDLRGTCGLVTDGLGYAGISWSPRSNNRAFVYTWTYRANPSPDLLDCTLDNSCNIQDNSYQV